MISDLKIELNNRIVSNETNVNYSHLDKPSIRKQ